MPYDPRMLQMARRGIGMMGPEQRDVFADPRSRQQQPQQWVEPAVQYGQPPNQPVNTPYDRSDDPSQPDDPNDPYARKKPPQPSLLQMLMLGGPATYSGTPRPGSQQGAVNPWGWPRGAR
jgi:hypothetical protein